MCVSVFLLRRWNDVAWTQMSALRRIWLLNFLTYRNHCVWCCVNRFPSIFKTCKNITSNFKQARTNLNGMSFFYKMYAQTWKLVGKMLTCVPWALSDKFVGDTQLFRLGYRETTSPKTLSSKQIFCTLLNEEKKSCEMHAVNFSYAISP